MKAVSVQGLEIAGAAGDRLMQTRTTGTAGQNNQAITVVPLNPNLGPIQVFTVIPLNPELYSKNKDSKRSLMLSHAAPSIASRDSLPPIELREHAVDCI